MSIKKEIEKWKPEKEEDDNVFQVSIDRISSKAASIRERLTKACNELNEACSDDPFGADFTTSLSDFCEASENDPLLDTKISEDVEEFKRRGLSKHQENMTAEQVKALITTFNGETSLTVFDALDTYRKTLSKSGINKALWGSVVLSKIAGRQEQGYLQMLQGTKI